MAKSKGRKKNNRLLNFILTLLILVIGAAISYIITSDEFDTPISLSSFKETENVSLDNQSGEATSTIQEIAEIIFSFDEKASLSSYKIKVDELEETLDQLAQYYPVEYDILFSVGYFYSSIGSYIESISTYNEIDLEEFKSLVNQVNTVVSDITNVTEQMSDFEAVVYVYNYLVLNCDYDAKAQDESYYGYSALVNGERVCAGYSSAFSIILNNLGIECQRVASENMDHEWNLVKLDDEWYHVDVTWGDPENWEFDSRINYDYFLLTDSQIEQLDHYDWETDIVADSTVYQNMPRYFDATKYISQNSIFYFDSEQTYQVFSGDKWYYYSDEALYSCDQYGDNITKVADGINDGLAVYEDRFYYAQGLDIISQSLTDSTDKEVIYSISGYDSSVYSVFAFSIIDGELTYYLYKNEYKENASYIVIGDSTISL